MPFLIALPFLVVNGFVGDLFPTVVLADVLSGTWERLIGFFNQIATIKWVIIISLVIAIWIGYNVLRSVGRDFEQVDKRINKIERKLEERQRRWEQ